MSHPQSERQHDLPLRQAIDRLLQNISSINTQDQLYRLVLGELCGLSKSTLGFVLQTQLGDNSQPRLTCSQILFTDPTEQPNVAEDLFDINLDQSTISLYSALAHNRPILLDKTSLQALNQATNHWPVLHQALLLPLPIRNASDGYGFCLANSRQAYSMAFAQRAWPLLSTCASLWRSIQPARSNEEKDHWHPLFSQVETLAPWGMIVLDENHRILRINPAAETIFRVKVGDLVQQPITRLIPERFETEHHTQTFHPSFQIPGQPLHVLGQKGNGETVPLDLCALHINEQQAHRILLMVSDHSDLQWAQAQHHSELQRFRTLSDLAPMGILHTNKSWETEYVNGSWLEITGCMESDIQGLNWSHCLYHEDAEANLQELYHRLTQGQEFQKDCRIQRKANEICWVRIHARPLYDNQGEPNGFLATMVDNSYFHETEDKLRKLAERDALTGLANRVLFMDRLEHALTRVHRHGSLALLALDLDGFKNVNDTLGHDAGDQLLVEVAQRLLSCVRSEDTVARVGGDEFIILLEDLTDASIAAVVSEKILKTLVQAVQILNQEVFISTSIGICLAVVGHDNSGKTLLKQADMALYRAKDAGRNNYQYYSPELEQASRRKLELGNSLHQAMTHTEFEVFYQGQANIQTGAIAGFEALLRWRHPKRGLLPPNEFIPLLENTGLIMTVSRWMLHVGLHELKRWISEGLVPEASSIAINISPCQFRDPLLLTAFKGALKDSGMEGENLVVEITETALLQDQEQTLNSLVNLREMGIKIALDDFGTGYSSLSHLKQFPIDAIKIDRSFIKDLLVDNEDAAITQAVLALARSLNLKVVAEGVDSPELLEQLRQWQCEYYQGYLLNTPMTAAEIERFLQEQTITKSAI